MVDSQRLSSPPLNMRCALSPPYLGWSGRGARALACASVVAFLSDLGHHRAFYFSFLFYSVFKGPLTELPVTFQLFYGAEMFSLA